MTVKFYYAFINAGTFLIIKLSQYLAFLMFSSAIF